MFSLFGSNPQNLDELIEKQEIEEQELRDVEEDLGFRLIDVFDSVEKTKSLPRSSLDTLKGRGSAVEHKDGKTKLKYKKQPDLPALARNGVYAKIIDEDPEQIDIHGDGFKDFLYTEFVASLAEEQVQRTELTRKDIDDFHHAHDNYQEARGEAIDAILEGSTIDGDREWLEVDDLDEIKEKRHKISDVEALIDARNFNKLDSLYGEMIHSENLESKNIVGTREKSKRFERAAQTYQLAKGVIVAREAARQYLEKGGGLVGAEEHEGVKPKHFLEPDEGLFNRTIDYLERAEEAFTGSPMAHVDIET